MLAPGQVLAVIFICGITFGTGVLVQQPVSVPSNCLGSLYQLVPDEADSSTEIVITAFFPFDGDGGTDYRIPAAFVALDEINNNSNLLRGYHLRLDIRNSSCDGSKGVHELILSIEERFRTGTAGSSLNLAVLGPGCSRVSERIAGVAGRFLHLPQVSYGYNSPQLMDRREYPSFFQIVRSINQVTQSALAVLDYFNWTQQISLIYQDEDIYTATIEEVVSTSTGGNFFIRDRADDPTILINIVEFTEFIDDSTAAAAIDAFLAGVRQANTRVIVGLLSERHAATLLCSAQNGIKPGTGFVWVFIGTFTEYWWQDTDMCNLTSADVESVLIISSKIISTNRSMILESERTFGNFKDEYVRRLQGWCPDAHPDTLSAPTYDAVWAIALALNQTSDELNGFNSSSGCQYHDSQIFGATQIALNYTDFIGATGQVQFGPNGEREGSDVIFQIQDGSMRLVGSYSRAGGLDLNSYEYSIVWPGGSVPSDIPPEVLKSVPVWILVLGISATVAGVIFSIAMFVFNMYYSNHRILRASSQKLNYVILVGTWLGYFSVFIFTIIETPLGQTMSDEVFQALCIIRLWALPFAFTFAYGTMFARAWRIYRIFNNPWISKRPLRDYHLLSLVCIVALGDLVILIPWTIIDPYRRFRGTANFEYSQFYRCIYVSCSSSQAFIWLAVIGAYKILLMLAGVFIVSLVRKGVVERKIYNDSRSLAVALYVAAIAFIVGLPLQILFALRFQINLAYATSATWVNISSSGTNICVFLPKFWRIVIKKQTGVEYKSAKSVFHVEYPDYECSVDDLTSFN